MEIMNLPDVEQFRKENAQEIRSLIADIERNSLKVGTCLLEVFDTFKSDGGSVNFRSWLQNEKIKMNEVTAYKFIQVARKVKSGKLEKLSTMVGFSVLQELMGNSIPEAVILEIEERANKGEVSVREARELVKQNKPPKPEGALPTPREANKIARETNSMVLASDDNYYFGHTKEEAQVIEERLAIVYGVRQAIETLAGMENEGFTPEKFVELMLPHQRWTEDEEHQLELAARWMQQLLAIWRRRN
jgi:hypothetical protein